VPWIVFVLLIANIAVGGYFVAQGTPRTETDFRKLEVNADKVKVLPPAAAEAGSAPRVEPAANPAVNPPANPAERPADKSAEQAAPKPVAAACLEWGTFGSAELERAQAQIAALGTTRTSVRELGPALAWWVHVPPLRSREEAERRAQAIEAGGVKDVQVVADGGRWRNAISLGIFKTEEAASAQLARMKAAGVRNATVVQRNDLLRLASLSILEPSPALVARVAELQSDFPGTELHAAACPP
jgi:hypothetical protein